MSIMNQMIQLSPIDEERFGIRTAKASIIEFKDIPDVMHFCEQLHVRFLIARCPTSHLRTAQKMEKAGFLLMDTLLYYSKNLGDAHSDEHVSDDVIIRPVRMGDEQLIRLISAESFKDYYGHYHSDERLDTYKCNEVYSDWAYKSCLSKDVADEVLVAEDFGEIVGFATMKINSPAVGEGALFGVAPHCQGKGIYRQLMVGGMHWCIEEGLERMIVSTQVTNVAVQKVWSRLGFEPTHSYYTFHKWFGESNEDRFHE